MNSESNLIKSIENLLSQDTTRLYKDFWASLKRPGRSHKGDDRQMVELLYNLVRRHRAVDAKEESLEEQSVETEQPLSIHPSPDSSMKHGMKQEIREDDRCLNGMVLVLCETNRLVQIGKWFEYAMKLGTLSSHRNILKRITDDILYICSMIQMTRFLSNERDDLDLNWKPSYIEEIGLTASEVFYRGVYDLWYKAMPRGSCVFKELNVAADELKSALESAMERTEFLSIVYDTHYVRERHQLLEDHDPIPDKILPLRFGIIKGKKPIVVPLNNFRERISFQ